VGNDTLAAPVWIVGGGHEKSRQGDGRLSGILRDRLFTTIEPVPPPMHADNGTTNTSGGERLGSCGIDNTMRIALHHPDGQERAGDDPAQCKCSHR
jgi:hypothetical protein